MRLVGTDELVDGKYPGCIAHSNQQYLYGFFEFYAKCPIGFTKPCCFLYDEDRTVDPLHPKNEIDAFEYGGNLHYLVGTYVNGDVYGISYPTTKAIMQDVYHKWGIYWQPDAVRVYMDDHLVWETTDPAQVPAVPINIDLQLAFGEWTYLPTDVTFPVYFDVDWVKVWVKDNTYR